MVQSVKWQLQSYSERFRFPFSPGPCYILGQCSFGPLPSAFSRWRHQMESFSALLALCAGNSPVNGEFPTQRPVTRSFDVFFDLRPNKRLSKQSRAWWFETPSRSLWRHCNVCTDWLGSTHKTSYKYTYIYEYHINFLNFGILNSVLNTSYLIIHMCGFMCIYISISISM